MPNRKRWFAELAGTFLLWVEEVAENPPWEAFILRRSRMGVVENAAGQLFTVQILETPESFVARSEGIAMDAAETTIRNDRRYQEYAHRLGEMKWQECDVSDEDWQERCARFLRGDEE